MRSRIRDRVSSRAQPVGDQLEDLVAAQVIEWFVESALEQVQLTHSRRTLVQLPAAGGIDQRVSRSRQYEKGDLDVTGAREDVLRSVLPFSACACRILVVYQRIVPVSLNHLRNP